MTATQTSQLNQTTTELRQLALFWLSVTEPVAKADGVMQLHQAWLDDRYTLTPDAVFPSTIVIPGRPARPLLVPPREVRQRAMHTVEGRAALIHALAHIEFNAINLALDAIWRYPGMPRAYYVDWLQVAAEESLHFSLLTQHLGSLGYAYGDFPAHGSLWEMAEKTQGDVLARMALVPRTLEARGLDATPAVRAKLAQAGDERAAAILDIILRDEIGHVAIGNHWYGCLCAARGLEPLSCYAELAERYRAPPLRGPFNLEARRQAGFTERELSMLGSGIGAP